MGKRGSTLESRITNNRAASIFFRWYEVSELVFVPSCISREP